MTRTYDDNYISEGFAPATGPPVYQLTGDWQDVQDWEDLQDWQDQQRARRGHFVHPSLQFGRSGGPMWGPWDTIFVIEGYSGTSRRTHGGPELDFNGFWIDLRTLLGFTSSSFC